MNNFKAIVSDLDGTLTINKTEVGDINYSTLEKLEKENVLRVIATGRSYYSAKKILPPDFPIDYLVFSSGAGVIDWKTKKLIAQHNIEKEKVSRAVNILKEEYTDFMIHFPVPENHNFYYHQTNRSNPDFERRINLYHEFAEELNGQELREAAQLLAVIHNETEEEFEKIKEKIDFLNIIRTTSPLDDSTVWMELFPADVSKSQSAQRLADDLGINSKEIIAIGNDYNDEDLLDWAGKSYVVGNAPEVFKERYSFCKPNYENGFTSIVKKHF
ncbi:MAG: HAD family hydrolase, partial [Rhodothermaceae bacterium]